MTPDRPSFPRALRLAIALALAAPAARAQLPPQTPQGLDQQQFTKAQGLYEQGKYADAVPLFEGIQGNFPTSPYIPAANLQAGVCHYFLGQYDQGVAALRKNLAGKGVTAEVIEDTQALIPQLLTAKAQKMPAGDPTRKTTLESAVKEFDTFIKNFPQSREVEQANLGKARAYYGLENFDEAAKPLRTNIEKYPASESAMDSQYMLALIQSTHGNEVMRKKTAPEEEKAATAAYEEAEKVFTGIIQKRTDLAMMNDSQFQLGEMLASRGSYEEKGEKQDRILYRSLDAYRNTFPKEAVVLAQKFRIKNFQDKMREAGTKADVQGLRYYQNLIQREQAKLTDLESRADQTLEAKLKSGRIYLQLHKDKERERMDEARVLFHFVEKFTEDAEQKKQILYNLTLTYAVQHVVEKAEESYKKWVDAFQKDPVGENLPLLMGAMYLDSDPKKNNPQKAIEYFDRQVAEFPTSKFAGDATMQKALAMIQLKQFDAGASALTDFLAKSPSKDQAVVAEFGLAIIYKDTNKVDLAIERFRAVMNKYPGTDQSEQAGYWVGQMLYRPKNDAKQSAAAMREFIAKFPKSDLVPMAQLTLGQAQRDSGQKDVAVKTFRELIDKSGQTEAAPFAFFQLAAIHHSDGKFDDLKAVMKEFIAKYPANERVYGAYDYVAQVVSKQEKKPEEAIALYEEYAGKYADKPQAATAILNVSDLWRKQADAMGRYIAVPQGQREQWRKYFDNSVAAAEKLLEKYPDSPEVAAALQNLLKAQEQFVLAKLKADANVDNYFNELAKKFAEKPTTASKIRFTLAAYYIKTDKKKSMDAMKAAYDPKLVYAPADLDVYAQALIDGKNYDEAGKIADKIAADNPIPKDADPNSIARSILEAHALSQFYKARTLQLKGNTAEGASMFAALKKNYPWSSKVMEADLGIAKDFFEQKKYDDAVKLARPVASSPAGPVEIRADAMMLLGQIAEGDGDFDTAINNYIKIASFFEGVPELAAEGLWRGAQLQEKKANGEVKQLPRATPAPEKKPAEPANKTPEPVPGK